MIVLAGGIGSGKSVVARILRLKGWGVYDCDLRAKCLMQEDDILVEVVKRLAGDDSYDEEGKLRRSLLASRIFSNHELRAEINGAVHAAVRTDLQAWASQAPQNIFVETAIAAQSGIAAEADAIWLVVADASTRLERVSMRDSRSDEEIWRIISLQEAEQRELLILGKTVERIFNDRDSESLLQQVGRLEKSI